MKKYLRNLAGALRAGRHDAAGGRLVQGRPDIHRRLFQQRCRRWLRCYRLFQRGRAGQGEKGVQNQIHGRRLAISPARKIWTNSPAIRKCTRRNTAVIVPGRSPRGTPPAATRCCGPSTTASCISTMTRRSIYSLECRQGRAHRGRR